MLSSIPSSKLEWYQTDDTVTITIKLKGIDPNNGIENMQFTEGSVKGVINHINKGKVDTYNIDIKLWGPIEYNNAKYDITPYKVELYLPKKDKLTQWPSLEKDNTIINKPPQAETAAAASSSYPSSSKVRKDWSKIDKICDDELKGEKENGDAALNELFRKIYKDADDDTRRAMIKSFQTSGGTVLSTNWDEVGKADYEGKDRPDAPDGQEWRKCVSKVMALSINDDIINMDNDVLNDRKLDDDVDDDEVGVVVITPTMTPKHRHDYHRTELIGAWLIITVVPIICIIFFCITAPPVRQREMLFKLFNRNVGIYNRGAEADGDGHTAGGTSTRDLELGPLSGGNTGSGGGNNNKLWDKIKGKSKAAAKVGSGMAATVIGKAKPVIKSATNRIDRSSSRVKRSMGRHHKRRQEGFEPLDGGGGGRGGGGGDHGHGYVKYNIYDDEDTNFGTTIDDDAFSSSSSSWSSSLVSSSRDGSPVSLIEMVPQQEQQQGGEGGGITTTNTFNGDDDLIGYYDYYEKEGGIEQQFREETILTTTSTTTSSMMTRMMMSYTTTTTQQQQQQQQVRRVSFDTQPPQEINYTHTPEIIEITDDGDNNGSVPTITDDGDNNGSVPTITDDGDNNGSIPTITDDGVNNGSVPTITDDGDNNGSIPTITDDGVNNGSVPTITDDGDNNGSIPTITDDGVNNGSIPTITDDGVNNNMTLSTNGVDGIRIRSCSSTSSRVSGNSRRLSGIISSDDDDERYMSANESNCYQSCYSSGGSTSDDEADEEGGDVQQEHEGIGGDMESSAFSSNESITSESDIITGGVSSDDEDDDRHEQQQAHDDAHVVKSCCKADVGSSR